MSKYDTSIKIKVIKEYEKILANLYYQKNKIPQTTISNWIKIIYRENYSSYEK